MVDLTSYAIDAARNGDFATALEIWQPLAEQGDADSMFGLGRMYARGDGVEQDFAKAHELFIGAAKLGQAKARRQASASR